MPEVLGDAGIYFNPEDPDSIAKSVSTLINDPYLRNELSKKASKKALEYSWARCGDETWSFMAEILKFETNFDA
jgi:glycosyltransferase involved in cell wall biosynthesis